MTDTMTRKELLAKFTNRNSAEAIEAGERMAYAGRIQGYIEQATDVRNLNNRIACHFAAGKVVREVQGRRTIYKLVDDRTGIVHATSSKFSEIRADVAWRAFLARA